MAGEAAYQLFDEADWKSLWDFAYRYPQHKAEFLKLGDDMHRFDKAVWHNGRNPTVLPPERPNLLNRLIAIVNQSPQEFSRDNDEIARQLDQMRERCESEHQWRVSQFSRHKVVDTPDSPSPQSLSRLLDDNGPVEFSEWRDEN